MCIIAEASGCQDVVLPVQDILGLDASGRMNVPGTALGNWQWRLESFDDLFSTSLPWEWNSLFWLVSGRGISLPGDHKYNPKKAYKEENDKAC